jgi:putative oligomerization/nucleic acid binding protein
MVMQQLTAAGNEAVQGLAQRYGVSTDAVTALLIAVNNGGGTMAQFYHPELGGGGQWMAGGMTMVGDMFNSRLQYTVSGLCSELAALLRNQQVFAAPPAPAQGSFGAFHPGNNWWPSELGSPSSSGGQNDSRYAYFPGTQRLAIDRGGQVTVYDALNHQIGGVQQQQGGSYGTLSFTSQFGTFTVDSLPVVSGGQHQQSSSHHQQSSHQTQQQQQQPYSSNQQPSYPQQPSYQQPSYQQSPPSSDPARQSSGSEPRSHSDVLDALQRLGQLHQNGILSDDEFRAKKAELLARL